MSQVVLVCRDAEEDSVIGNVALAKAFGAGGHEVAIVFAAGALHALGRATFQWSDTFKSRDARSKVITNGVHVGVDSTDPERDRRWSDVRAMLERLADEGTVELIACPLWSALLGNADEPAYLARLDSSELVARLAAADTIVGSY